MKRAPKILISVFAMLLIVSSLSGCGLKLKVYDIVEDFDGVLDGMEQIIPDGGDRPPQGDDNPEVNEPDIPDIPDIPVEPDEIVGFRLAGGAVLDGPALFSVNAHAVVKAAGKTMLVDKEGNLSDAPPDITELIYDKYIFQENGLKGVKDLQGNVVLDARFDSISIIKDTLLAADATSAYLFRGKEMLRALPLKRKPALFDADTVILSGELYDLALQPLTAGGYRVVNYREDIAVIEYEGRLGYYDMTTEKMIAAPEFAFASVYINGTAFAQRSPGGEYVALDKSGRELAELVHLPYGCYDGYLFVSDGSGGLILYDDAFSDTGLRFSEVYGNRVYGDFVIDDFSMRIFSISRRSYVTDSMLSVLPADGLFVCKSGRQTALLDQTLTPLITADDMVFSGGMLSVKTAEGYHLYKRTE